MPNKTIYISDGDLPIFEKAQHLAGENLSATIVQALRRFIDAHESRNRGFRDITVKVGTVAHTYKRFNGRQIAKGFYAGSSESRGRKIEVYLTAKGRIALYIQYLPNGWFPGGRHDSREHRQKGWWSGLAEFQGWQSHGGQWGHWQDIKLERVLDVYDNLEAARDQLPPDLYQAAAQSMTGGTVEFLDI